ncbi:MAG TPA: hypothetical protein VK843_21975 [Planctomycetota bacterium]|nr:hypothetical protein [Planctomycetota bacterium]
MNPECRNFRARLADALRGPLDGALPPAARVRLPALGGSTGLGWHAHVIHCAECRELLSEEEALDELLRSLPQPHLPPALAERVLSRLDGARRGVDLDRLLDLQQLEPAPADLARSVIARVHAEQALDRLLEGVPAEVPAGLDRRVLARLQLARRAGKPLVRSQLAAAAAESSETQVRERPARRLLRIAAGFALVSLAGWGAWTLRRAFFEKPENAAPDLVRDSAPLTPQSSGTPTSPTTPELAATGEPDDALLASLEMFEAWDLLATSGGVDASLATLDSLDEYLLDFESAATLPATTDGATSPADPASGSDSDTRQPKKNG